MKKILLFTLLLILSSCSNNDITDPYSKNGISKLGASPDEDLWVIIQELLTIRTVEDGISI